jgi:hypothetical protein
MLHLETESEDVYLPRVSWISLENPACKMEKITLGKLERLSFRYVKNNALENNTSKELMIITRITHV